MYLVTLADRARRSYEKADAGLQRRLDRCFDQLKLNPQEHPNIKRLSGTLSGHWRYRVGDYRVIYRIENQRRIVVVMVIAHRKDVYE